MASKQSDDDYSGSDNDNLELDQELDQELDHELDHELEERKKLQKEIAQGKSSIKRYVIPKYDMGILPTLLRDIGQDSDTPSQEEETEYKELVCTLIRDEATPDTITKILRLSHVIKFVPNTIGIIKNFFHTLIVDERRIEFVEKYNKIFNDDLYKDITAYYKAMPIIPQDVLDSALVKYNAKVAAYMKQTHSRRQMPTFYDGQIIGAKDRDGKWWLSQVITSVTYGEHKAYYVRFCGFDEMFNEWIGDRYRVRFFNPYKHKLYRRMNFAATKV